MAKQLRWMIYGTKGTEYRPTKKEALDRIKELKEKGIIAELVDVRKLDALLGRKMAYGVRDAD